MPVVRWREELSDALASPLQHRGVSTLLLLAALCGFTAQAPVSRYVNGLVSHQLPFPHSREVVSVSLVHRSGSRMGVGEEQFERWQGRTPALAALATYRFVDWTAGYTGRAQRLGGAQVTADFFAVVKPSPAAGRLLLPSDFEPGGAPAALLSDRAWETLCRRDPHAIGSKIRLGEGWYRVVGVMPRDFWWPGRPVDVWVPQPVHPASTRFEPRTLFAVGRLRPGATVAQAQGEFRAAEKNAPRARTRTLYGATVGLQPLDQEMWGDVTPALFMLLLPFGVLLGKVSGQLLRHARDREHRSDHLRYWLFLCGKNVLLSVALVMLWLQLIDLAEPLTHYDFAVVVITEATLYLGFFLLCARMAQWSWADQRHRCHVCLRRVQMPLPRGSYGSILLDRPGAEYVCPAGHGQLYVPARRPTDEEPTDFTPSRGMWEELSSPLP